MESDRTSHNTGFCAAETEVLTRMFGREPHTTERLSEILTHAPERFAEVIRDMEQAVIPTMALLSARLGRQAVAAIVRGAVRGTQTQLPHRPDRARLFPYQAAPRGQTHRHARRRYLRAHRPG